MTRFSARDASATHRVAAAGLLLLLAQCGGDNSGPTPDPVATRLAFATAPSGSATAGAPLAVQPVVELRSAAGQRVAAAGVSVTAGVSVGGLLGTATVTTNAEGRAAFTDLALTGAAGARALTFSAGSLTAVSQNITLVVPANSIAATTPTSQSARAGSVLTPGPAVRVTDAGGAPVAGATVTFAVTIGGGSIPVNSLTTDANGIAQLPSYTLGPLAGAQRVEATLAGTSSKVLFTVTATVSGTVQLVSPDWQLAVSGTQVPAPPTIVVNDPAGVVNVEVRFRIVTGGGSISETLVFTDQNGNASAALWTLGPVPAVNQLEIIAVGYSPSPIIAHAIGVTALPATLEIVAGNNQSAVPGTTLPIAPAVRILDGGGQPVAGYPVTFEEIGEAGVLTGAQTVTDGAGEASLGSWTLPGSNGTVQIRVDDGQLAGAPIVFSATASSNAPSQIQVLDDNAAGTVGEALGTSPRIRVENSVGAGVDGVTVTFQAAAGSGSITAPTVVTSGGGFASPGVWTLGTTSGAQTVTAQAAGLATATLHATAVGGPAVSIAVASGDGQTGYVYNPLANPATVILRDQYGNPSPGGSVTFALTGGGGRLVNSTAVTDAGGLASARWYLGATPGPNGLSATRSGVGSVSFSASAIAVASPFDIDVRWLSTPTGGYQTALDAAVARWRAIIRSELANATLNRPADECFDGQPAVSETIDDLLLFVQIIPIDGAGGVLGSAGPCILRGPGGLPSLGVIRLDAADASALDASGDLRDVLTHELAHVLGFGTVWETKLLVSGGGTPSSSFTGPVARSWYQAFGGSAVNVPLETTGGVGTADAHWRESVFGNELMTGFIASGFNPLSKVSVGSMVDIGYSADFSTADPLSFTLSVRRGIAVAPRLLREGLLPSPIIIVDGDGSERRVPRHR